MAMGLRERIGNINLNLLVLILLIVRKHPVPGMLAYQCDQARDVNGSRGSTDAGEMS